MVFVVINIHIDSLLLHPLGQGEIFNTYSGRFQAQFGQCRAPSTGSYDQSFGFLKEKREFKLVEGFLWISSTTTDKTGAGGSTTSTHHCLAWPNKSESGPSTASAVRHIPWHHTLLLNMPKSRTITLWYHSSVAPSACYQLSISRSTLTWLDRLRTMSGVCGSSSSTDGDSAMPRPRR